MGLPQFSDSRDYERLSEDQRAFLDRLALLLTRAVVVSYDWYDHLHFGYGEPDPPVEEVLGFPELESAL